MGSSDRRVRFNVFSRAAVIAGGNRCVREETKASREKATWAASFWRVGWDFRAALWAKSECASHYRRVPRTLPSLLRKILSEVTPGPQQLDGAAHLQCRWASQLYGR